MNSTPRPGDIVVLLHPLWVSMDAHPRSIQKLFGYSHKFIIVSRELDPMRACLLSLDDGLTYFVNGTHAYYLETFHVIVYALSHEVRRT